MLQSQETSLSSTSLLAHTPKLAESLAIQIQLLRVTGLCITYVVRAGIGRCIVRSVGGFGVAGEEIGDNRYGVASLLRTHGC